MQHPEFYLLIRLFLWLPSSSLPFDDFDGMFLFNVIFEVNYTFIFVRYIYSLDVNTQGERMIHAKQNFFEFALVSCVINT